MSRARYRGAFAPKNIDFYNDENSVYVRTTKAWGLVPKGGEYKDNFQQGVGVIIW